MVWLGATTLLWQLSGWRGLERRYPDQPGDPELRRLRGQSASLGTAAMPVNYSGCLTFDVCLSGLRIRVWRIFGLFARPLFVPWADITSSRRSWLLWTMVDLRFARWPNGTMRIGERAFNGIPSASAGRLSTPPGV